ncbi:hypothetical protein GUITHDRAFT_148394 [Guillardia theta CCMP2712]|uniref:carbonic anhydrase n=2 Tax=Guillardia theta TaxID=55529 RepID=L1IA38_GUITC|nr:hypothetical protein GUITHDRAFT_148394 [Guillardia theta CCMP2712]EKX32759.1 hypothetical protein GUITHDRAFT_148394 [Guillardia theta CCMP2712]|eukprot:XP_005819739.1 hypothetical protein GUITHDRAFT_148394 [Guillardia theta CCMP2712]
MLLGFLLLIFLIAFPALVVAVVAFTRIPGDDCALNVTTPVTQTAHAIHWDYSPEHGPEHWASLTPDYATCGSGKLQSPINLRTSVGPKYELGRTLKNISMNNFQDVSTLVKNSFSNLVTVVHNGHTVQTSGVKGYFQYDSTWFELLQFHFHTPSEHQLDDNLQQAEIHFVHKSQSNNYLVIGVFVETADENPEYFKELLADFPKSEEEAAAIVHFNYTQLLQDVVGDNANYWMYSGSFTTPNCQEGVTWIVMNKKVKMTAKDIGALRNAMGKNNRPIQPLNERTVHMKSLPI